MAQEPMEIEGTGQSNEVQKAPPPRRQFRSRPYRQDGGGQDQDQGDDGPSSRRSMRFQPRRKVCIFCADKTKVLDWKRLENLRRFIGDSGEIYPRRKSGLCARHQRRVAAAIKRARHLALIPYTSEHIRVMNRG